MRIVADQRFVLKPDGKRWLQVRYYENLYVDAGGALGFSQATLSDWADIPLCEDDFKDADKLEGE